MLLEKKLAQTLQIIPNDPHKGDRLVATASVAIFAAMVGLATANFREAAKADSTHSRHEVTHRIHFAKDTPAPVEAHNVSYTYMSPDAMKALAMHITDKWRVGYIESSKLVTMVDDAAQQTNLDAKLILAVIAKESSFDPASKSNVGAEGLMQVWRKWHHEKFTGINTASPHQNVVIGSSILKEYLDTEKGDVVEALQRYNGSKGDESKRYATGVLTLKSEFERINYSVAQNQKPRFSNI